MLPHPPRQEAMRLSADDFKIGALALLMAVLVGIMAFNEGHHRGGEQAAHDHEKELVEVKRKTGEAGFYLGLQTGVGSVIALCAAGRTIVQKDKQGRERRYACSEIRKL